MSGPKWHKLGSASELNTRPLQPLQVGSVPIALSYADGRFGAILGTCLHDGGPLGEGTLEDNNIVCPWHGWTFNRLSGEALSETPAAVARFNLKEEHGDLYIDTEPATASRPPEQAPHPLTRDITRQPGPIRVVGLSTTVMNRQHPRFSTSDYLLEAALAHARETLGAETRLIKLNDLSFRHCEGYYSKGADTCTWPCTITQQDAGDELLAVYESLVFWGDVVLVATPIRWGAPSSLHFKMIERMNCIQNQITVANRVLIRNKVASFIITGGQDNIQAVVGLMMMFFGELGFLFPQFPFIAHSRDWTAEDMEANVVQVRESAELREGACALAGRCVAMAADLSRADQPVTITERGGRKAHPIVRAS
jgi:nitrite reductase/ring-hydroxylating ferredoxin subunit/multimeric flavodoxin WrbA